MRNLHYIKLFLVTFLFIFFISIFFSNFPAYKISTKYVSNNSDINPAIISKNLDYEQQEIKLPTANPVDYINFPVSKTNSLGTYAPTDLVTLSLPYSTRNIKVRIIIVKDLINLIRSAEKDGINLKVVSGYRSYSDQVNTFNYYVQTELKSNPSLSKEEAIAKANTYSAKPGHSEHQLGTTVDILSSETNYEFSSDPNLKFAKWLETNARKFNFSISFPQGNNEYVYEPWHIRWRD